MRHRSIRSLLAFLALAACASCLGGLFTGQDCDCVTGGFSVLIPADLAASVASVKVSGGPCDSLPEYGLFCESAALPDGGGSCAGYHVNVMGPGVCEIAVTFNDGSAFHATTIVTGLEPGSCCYGEYFAADVNVTAAP